MPSRRALPVLAILLILATALPSRAQEAGDALPPGVNAICPVMEDEPASAKFFVDHDGRRIYFCCKRCVTKFTANPAAYLPNLPPAIPAAETPADFVPPPVFLPSAEAADPAPPPSSTPTAPAAAPRPFIDRLSLLAGRLHVTILHFPIALILTATLLHILGGLTRRPTLRAAARTILILGALSALATAGTGWLNARHDRGGLPDASTTLSLHRWLALATTALAIIAAATALAHPRPSPRADDRASPDTHTRVVTPRPILTLQLLLLTALLTITSHLGGTLVHGPDYLTQPLHDLLSQPASTPTTPTPAAPAAPPSPSAPAEGVASAGGGAKPGEVLRASSNPAPMRPPPPPAGEVPEALRGRRGEPQTPNSR